MNPSKQKWSAKVAAQQNAARSKAAPPVPAAKTVPPGRNMIVQDAFNNLARERRKEPQAAVPAVAAPVPAAKRPRKAKAQ